ncbi:MAG: hypothetical protein ACO4AK_11150, partial [Candidatus Nanopelagicales bacterium]
MSELSSPRGSSTRRRILTGFAVAAIVLVIAGLTLVTVLRSTISDSKAAMYDGKLVSADYWTDEPQILSSGFGFDGIIGSTADDEQ